MAATMSTSNRKVTFLRAGGPEVVTVVSDDLEPPKDNEVTIKILYAGFSTTDINMREGRYPMQKSFPLTPGYCLVGRVHAFGPKASSSGLHHDQLVTALTVYDAQAMYANVETKYLVPLPDSLQKPESLPAATALAVDWLTAYGMLVRPARKVLQLDQSTSQRRRTKVFIHGLSGAVGQALLRLTQALCPSTEITGTASARNHGDLLKQGCAHVYDYKNKEWIASVRNMGGVHAVFDPLGFESWDESYSILSSRDPSILVGYGGNGGLYNGESRSVVIPTAKLLARNLSFCKKSTSFFYIDKTSKSYRPDLQALISLLAEKKIEVPIKKIVDGLDQVPVVHKEWIGMSGMGSAVVKIMDF